MSRVQFNDGQEVTFQDLNRIMQLTEKWSLERTLYHLVGKQAEGFFQDSFYVDFTDSTHVSVRAGVGIQEDLTQVTPETTRRMVYKAVATTLSLAVADVTDPRRDIVVVRADRAVTLSSSRNIKDFISSVVAPQTIDVETDWIANLQVVTGTPAGSPVDPATPSGFIKIASILVPATTGPTSQANLTDTRVLMPITENTAIDTSLFVAVPTKAVGTPLKTVLSELDALAVAYSAVQRIYDSIVGSTLGCTHASLAAAMTAVSAGARILVTESAALAAAIACNKADVEIHLKPGVVISKNTATIGFDITASGVEIHGGKISGFSAPGDVAIVTSGAAPYCKVWGVRFATNTVDIDDALEEVVQFGNISE